ncbi:patatin-like phospholipase family protein [Pseudorhodoferax sp.]|uniref:patatin-like phospholipase family protein n=1 Tax=Pseudorhodoferax sp. TaxID=1993553 RepID=UPI0039E2944E
MADRTKKKRAIALAGGGPAAGLHIGALAALQERDVAFDVFALSCVGAWVGLVYNTRPGPDRAQQTYEYFETHCFRDDDGYEWFPVNRGFAPDCKGMFDAWSRFAATTPLDAAKLVLPAQIWRGLLHTQALALDPGRWTLREFNYWVLNDVLAVNPLARFWTSLTYQSDMKGLSRIYYDDSPALRDIFEGAGPRLDGAGMPDIYHNAWRLPKDGKPGAMQIFHNAPARLEGRADGYMPITAKSLCACSALPFIEESIEIDGDEYTEGALVDTVNFKNLLRDHPDLDEVWVSRIVDNRQVHPAKGLLGSLSNLPMQFAAEVGENDVKLFRQHLLNQTRMRPRVVEIPILSDTDVSFHWSHKNLRQGYDEGKSAVEQMLEADPELARPYRAD